MIQQTFSKSIKCFINNLYFHFALYKFQVFILDRKTPSDCIYEKLGKHEKLD